MVTKNDIPLALEHFDDNIVGKKEVYKSNSFSPFGSYLNCSDYAFLYWGSKLVYSVYSIDNIKEKVVVYNDKVLIFEIDNKEIDDECINIIKEKLIN